MDSPDTTSLIPDSIVARYEGKSVLITGAMGYIGSRLTEAFSVVNCRLLLLDLPEHQAYTPENSKADISYAQGDVSLPNTWEFILPGVDYVFHLAAVEYNRANFDMSRDLQVNAVSVFHMLEQCRKNNYHPKIVFSSSANLFGMVDMLPVNENCPDDPLSLWSAHKLMAEHYFHIYAQRYGIESIILRLANVYGPTADKVTTGNVVINRVIAKALSGSVLVTYSNRNCLRDYVYLDDVVRAFLYTGVIDRSLYDGRLYVVGSGEGKTIAEVWQIIADKVKAYMHKDVSVEANDSVKLEPLDMRQFVADSAAFRKVTNWKPQVALEKGADLTVRALMELSQHKHAEKIY